MPNSRLDKYSSIQKLQELAQGSTEWTKIVDFILPDFWYAQGKARRLRNLVNVELITHIIIIINL